MGIFCCFSSFDFMETDVKIFILFLFEGISVFEIEWDMEIESQLQQFRDLTDVIEVYVIVGVLKRVHSWE